MTSFEPNDPALARRYFADKLTYTTGPTELADALETGAVRVIDVRAREAFAREHIPGSINLPQEDWSTERGLARDQTNVLLCYSHLCGLAARAAVQLAERGYQVMELNGGFEGWKAHGLPTESEAAAHHEPLDRARALLAQARTTPAAAPPTEKQEATAQGTKAKAAKADRAAKAEATEKAENAGKTEEVEEADTTETADKDATAEATEKFEKTETTENADKAAKPDRAREADPSIREGEAPDEGDDEGEREVPDGSDDEREAERSGAPDSPVPAAAPARAAANAENRKDAGR